MVVVRKATPLQCLLFCASFNSTPPSLCGTINPLWFLLPLVFFNFLPCFKTWSFKSFNKGFLAPYNFPNLQVSTSKVQTILQMCFSRTKSTKAHNKSNTKSAIKCMQLTKSTMQNML